MQFRRNAYPEFAAVMLFGQRLRDRLSVSLQVGYDIGNNLPNSGKGSALFFCEPGERREFGAQPDELAIFRRPGNAVGVMINVHA